MNALNTRLNQDIEKISNLCKKYNNKISIKSKNGNPTNELIILFLFKTVGDSSYPNNIINKSEVKINLSNNYPFNEPEATFITKIYHPNVYKSGKICFGNKWLPSEGLDMLVERIVKLIIFDSNILNEKSPANNDALQWYRKNQSLFPTESLRFLFETKKIKVSWNNIIK